MSIVIVMPLHHHRVRIFIAIASSSLHHVVIGWQHRLSSHKSSASSTL